MKTPQFVILDRDGTIVVERHYLATPEDVELLPQTVAGLRLLKTLGLGLIVITNQSALGRGFLKKEKLDSIHHRMNELLESNGITVDGIYVCPHTPEDSCMCRKPQTGLIDQAGKDFDLDPTACVVIGDKESDIELGRRIGAITILVRTGYGADVAKRGSVEPNYVVDGLWDAALVVQNLITKKERLSDVGAKH